MKIYEKLYVPINGQEQYILIRGTDEKKPVILSLHGGPAGPDAYFTNALANEICDEYIFVSWDQRGCGRTYFRNKRLDPNNESATFEQALYDVDALVTYLCERFHQEKIIIMGHSYGTLLGMSYVYSNSEKVEKYIGIGQSVSILQTEEANYKEVLQVLAKCNRKSDKVTIAFEKFKQTPSLENFTSYKTLTLRHLKENRKDIVQTNQFKIMFSSSDFSGTDMRWLLGMMNIKKHYVRNKKLLDYTLLANLNEVGNNFSVPMYFISGEYDVSCNVGLVKTFYEKISAPEKDFVVMEKCGHSPHVDNPSEFAIELKRMLRQTGTVQRIPICRDEIDLTKN